MTYVKQADEAENLRARELTRTMIDASITVLSQMFENHPLSFRSLMLKMLVEDLNAVDHAATFKYLRGIHEELCGQPIGDDIAADDDRIRAGLKAQGEALTALGDIITEVGRMN